jgi:predicted transcriptional regulator
MSNVNVQHMKFLIYPAAFLVTMLACSRSSFESDVKKMAKYRCEMRKLLDMDLNDEKVQEKMSELRKKMEDFSEKMQVKYKDKLEDKEMEQEADRIMEKEMAKCL